MPNILNVPIRINGQDSSSDPIPSSLTTRELFVAINGDLYTGTGQSRIKVNCNVSDSTKSIVSTVDSSMLNLSISSSTFSLGGLNYNNSNKTFTSSSVGSTKFSGIGLENIPRIVLNSQMYGSSLPSSGTQGQLFFLLQ